MTTYVDAAMNLSAQTRRETLEEVEALVETYVEDNRRWTLAASFMRTLLDDIKKLDRESA